MVKGRTKISTAGKRTEGGYTLIELVLVIVIVGVVLYIAAPKVRDDILNDSLRASVRQFVGLVKELRQDAIREQIDYILHVDIGANRYWIETSDMTPEKREYAHFHHASHMLSKEILLAQVQARFSCAEIETALNQWGFYETEYGIGIFCFWETQFVRNAIGKMRAYLFGLNVATREEYSDARWVYRFRIEANREIHTSLLKQFCQP